MTHTTTPTVPRTTAAAVSGDELRIRAFLRRLGVHPAGWGAR